MKISTLKIFTAGILLSLASCSSEKQENGNAVPAVKVSVVTAEMSDAGSPKSFSGIVKAVRETRLSTKLMGRVLDFPVEEGQKIKKGQLLVRVDSKDLLAKKEQAKAGLKQAESAFANIKKDYERVGRLHAKKSATDKELDDITNAYNAMSANLEAAKQGLVEINQTLAYATLRSPFDGYVTKKFMSQGDMATPGMPVVAVEAEGDYKLVALVPESDLASVAEGADATIRVDALGKEIPAKIHRLNVSSAYSGAQYEVDVRPVDESAQLRSGMHAYLDLSGKGNSKLLVPEKYLVKRGQLTGIYTVSKAGKAKLRWLRLGKKVGASVEVLSGLKAGEKIVTGSKNRLRDGQPVKF
ncbi:RND transporter [Fulvitalea axinellae]|uniref:RND transporter n=1 Tax=Fulvitalea axinellae TaxID=1182444 RepID=A0AAU9CGT9_9BACT|nr:RND transporter [Fulvitalea axinellae]